MPIYEFTCNACGSFTVQRPVAEAGARAVCPHCGSDGARVYAVNVSRGRPRRLNEALFRADATAASPGIVRRAEHDSPARYGSVAPGARPWQIEH